jgi:hypothetical protein
MKVKVSTATTNQLDWLVATCEGLPVNINSSDDIIARRLYSLTPDEVAALPRPKPYCTVPGFGQAAFSSDWSQGGPIIERENIFLSPGSENMWPSARTADGMDTGWVTGETKLIAAMRCYVASKMGDVVEVPDQLVE